MDYSSSYTIESTTNPGVTFVLQKPSHGRKVEFDRANATFKAALRDLNRAGDALNEEIDALRAAFHSAAERELAQLRSDPNADPARLESLQDGEEMDRLRANLAYIGPNGDDTILQPMIERVVALSKKNPHTFVVPKEWNDQVTEINAAASREIDSTYKPARLKWGLRSIDGLTINAAPATVESLLADGPRDLVEEIFAAIEKMSRFTPEQLKNSEWPIISNASADGPKTNTTATDAATENSTEPGTASNSANTPSS